MKKIVFALVVLMFAAPAWADVDVTAEVGECEANTVVTISFDAGTEPNLVRAFGLNIQCDNDANILEVTGINPDYYIYPGTIQINVDGEVTYQGTIAAEYGDLPSDTLPGPPDGNGVTIECASLYAPVGPGSPNAPDDFGPLLTFSVDKTCNVTITANVSRAGATGVVMEDPDEVVTVNLPATFLVEVCADVECMKLSNPAHADWEAWEKPLCWCYAKQCRGDINGKLFFGKTVTSADLAIFKNAFNKNDTDLALVTNGICADLNMASFFGKRVTSADLNIFKTYFNLVDAEVPECDSTHYNMPWETPD